MSAATCERFGDPTSHYPLTDETGANGRKKYYSYQARLTPRPVSEIINMLYDL
jgi:hypothetical protein